MDFLLGANPAKRSNSNIIPGCGNPLAKTAKIVTNKKSTWFYRVLFIVTMQIDAFAIPFV